MNPASLRNTTLSSMTALWHCPVGEGWWCRMGLTVKKGFLQKIYSFRTARCFWWNQIHKPIINTVKTLFIYDEITEYSKQYSSEWLGPPYFELKGFYCNLITHELNKLFVKRTIYIFLNKIVFYWVIRYLFCAWSNVFICIN